MVKLIQKASYTWISIYPWTEIGILKPRHVDIPPYFIFFNLFCCRKRVLQLYINNNNFIKVITCRAALSSSAPSPITTYVHFRPYLCTTLSKHDSFEDPVEAEPGVPPPPDLPPPVDGPPPPPDAEYTFSTAKCGPSPYRSNLASAGIRCVVVTRTLTQLGLRRS